MSHKGSHIYRLWTLDIGWHWMALDGIEWHWMALACSVHWNSNRNQPRLAFAGGAYGSTMSTSCGGGFHSRLTIWELRVEQSSESRVLLVKSLSGTPKRNSKRKPSRKSLGQVQLLRELLQRDASCAQRDPLSGCTALHLAARNGEEETKQQRMDNGCFFGSRNGSGCFSVQWFKNWDLIL